MRYDLRGKSVVLTGASRGIGRALAEKLADEGARLGLAARDKTKLDDTKRLVESKGAAAFSFLCDVTNDESVNKMVADGAEKLGGIDVFINVAGITLEKTIEDAAVEDYQRVLNTNLLGAVRCTKAALPHLKKSRGVIVNVASLIVHAPFPRLGVYAVSKWALAAYSHTLRQELHGTGVRVLTVYPTIVRTDMVSEEPVLAKSPSQSPEECAGVIVSAIKKGKLETGTAYLPKLLSAVFAVHPPWADKINRLFLPTNIEDKNQ